MTSQITIKTHCNRLYNPNRPSSCLLWNLTHVHTTHTLLQSNPMQTIWVSQVHIHITYSSISFYVNKFYYLKWQ
jgi:hypothetical protein